MDAHSAQRSLCASGSYRTNVDEAYQVPLPATGFLLIAGLGALVTAGSKHRR